MYGAWLDCLGVGLARGVYLLTCWPVRRRTSAENFSLNQARDIKGAFVSSQKSEQAAGLRYGHTACGRTGCGGIAIYNALTALGLRVSLAEVLYQLERRRCAAAGGRLGTHPFRLRRVLNLYPVRARRVYRMESLEEEMRAVDAAIVAIWNDRSHPLRGAHFFALRRSAAEFEALNREGIPACGTLAEIVGRGRFITGCLLHRESA